MTYVVFLNEERTSSIYAGKDRNEVLRLMKLYRPENPLTIAFIYNEHGRCIGSEKP